MDIAPEIKIDKNPDTGLWEAWIEDECGAVLLARKRGKGKCEGAAVRIMMKLTYGLQKAITPQWYCGTCEITSTTTETCPKCEGAMRPVHVRSMRAKATAIPVTLDPEIVLQAFQGHGEYLTPAKVRATLAVLNIEPLPSKEEIAAVLREQLKQGNVTRRGYSYTLAEKKPCGNE